MYIDFKVDRLKPYAASLAIGSSRDKQSNAFDKSVSRTPKEFLLKFHFDTPKVADQKIKTSVPIKVFQTIAIHFEKC